MGGGLLNYYLNARMLPQLISMQVSDRARPDPVSYVFDAVNVRYGDVIEIAQRYGYGSEMGVLAFQRMWNERRGALRIGDMALRPDIATLVHDETRYIPILQKGGFNEDPLSQLVIEHNRLRDVAIVNFCIDRILRGKSFGYVGGFPHIMATGPTLQRFKEEYLSGKLDDIRPEWMTQDRE
jgi:hypothetical protein